MIFFSSDHHFNHANIIQYCDRPWVNDDRTLDVGRMNSELIRLWNETIKQDDVVYYLGDFAFGPRQYVADIVKLLNGRKFLIKGNHDRFSNTALRTMGFEDVYSSLIIHDNTLGRLLLTHAPRETFTEDWNLHGHVHCAWRSKNKNINIGIDVWDFKPVSIDDLKNLISAMQ